MKKMLVAIGAVAVVIILCFGLFAASTYLVGYVVRGTRPLPADAAHFDPIVAYPDIVTFTGDKVQLLQISMKFVKADGTLDLTADYGASVSYRFAHAFNSPPSKAPLSTGGRPSGTFAEGIDVNVEKPGMDGGSHDQYYNFGMTRIDIPSAPLTESIAADPTCTAKQLWDVALEHDAPADAVAIIRYTSTGYRFNIADTTINFRFDTACNLIK